MNSLVVKIFDILNDVSTIQELGPIRQSTYHDLIFGIKKPSKKITKTGYFGYEFCHKYLERNTAFNTYKWNFHPTNFNDNLIDHCYQQHLIIHNECIVPIYRQIYDAISVARLYQTEVGRVVGIPENLSGTKQHCGYMLAECINRLEALGNIRFDQVKKGARKYIIPVKPIDNIKTEYTLTKSFQSNNESLVNATINDILSQNKYQDLVCKWNVSLPDWRNAPYDFGIFNNGTLIGMFEVDGPHHYDRNFYFYNSHEEFENRKCIDERKTMFADDQNIPLCRITEAELFKNTTKKAVHIVVKNKIKQFIESII
jgi:hypothetical protein